MKTEKGYRAGEVLSAGAGRSAQAAKGRAVGRVSAVYGSLQALPRNGQVLKLYASAWVLRRSFPRRAQPCLFTAIPRLTPI